MIKRELIIFLIVGILSVLIDFLSYSVLLRLDINISKAIGFLMGTVFSYFANRFLTFGRKSHMPGSPWRFATLYACTICVNVLVNSYALKIFANMFVATQLAFLVATIITASINFLGMKLYVFRAYTS